MLQPVAQDIRAAAFPSATVFGAPGLEDTTSSCRRTHTTCSGVPSTRSCSKVQGWQDHIQRFA